MDKHQYIIAKKSLLISYLSVFIYFLVLMKKLSHHNVPISHLTVTPSSHHNITPDDYNTMCFLYNRTKGLLHMLYKIVIILTPHH